MNKSICNYPNLGAVRAPNQISFTQRDERQYCDLCKLLKSQEAEHNISAQEARHSSALSQAETASGSGIHLKCVHLRK